MFSRNGSFLKLTILSGLAILAVCGNPWIPQVWADPPGGGDPSPPPPETSKYDCKVVQDSASNWDDIFSPADAASRPANFETFLKKTFDFNAAGNDPHPTVQTGSAQNYVFIRVYCTNEASSAPALLDAEARFELGNSINTTCDSSSAGSSGLCAVAYQVGPDNAVNYFKLPGNDLSALKVPKEANGYVLAGVLVLGNQTSDEKTLRGDHVKFRIQDAGGGHTKHFQMSRDLTIVDVGEPSCGLSVTGRKNEEFTAACTSLGSCPAIPVTETGNERLKFEVYVKGLPAPQAVIVGSPTWNPGVIDSQGFWRFPTVNTVTLVTAEVKLASNKKLYCGMNVFPVGIAFSMRMTPVGDCAEFSALKNYWYKKADGTNQTTGYRALSDGAKGIPYLPPDPNMGTRWGVNGPELPFGGLLNAMASMANGTIQMGPSGIVNPPAESDRRYDPPVAVIMAVGGPVNPKTGRALPLYWGEYAFQSPGEMGVRPTGIPLPANFQSTSAVVIQLFLPAKRRGANAPPRWLFSPEIGDKYIMLRDGSCDPAFTIVSDVREDRPELPEVLRRGRWCIFTKPQYWGDVSNGRTEILRVTQVVPESRNHTYPPDLFRTSRRPPCVVSAVEATDTVPCVQIPATYMPPSSGNLNASHDQCLYSNVVTGTGVWYDNYGNPHTYTTYTVVRYLKANCNVVEDGGECGKSLALRFAGYYQMASAALACYLKYNGRPLVTGGPNLALDNVAVTATLGPNGANMHGILPYDSQTRYGGANPAVYTNYPFLTPPAPHNTIPKLGVGCIPCRFETHWGDLDASTAPLTTDQDAPTNPRKPIYTFTTSSSPRACVWNETREGRYFGSSACTGTNNPPGHFCSSCNPGVTGSSCGTSTLFGQNCPSSSPETVNGVTLSGGGNVAFKIKDMVACPGSQSEYAYSSVSWSPLILDLAGDGTEISRTFHEAVLFDIKAAGKRVMVDWPLDTNDSAFLVRPNSQGAVTSIRELFGDFKSKNGFEALKKLDTNRDKRIDKKDKNWKQLALWFDRNRNGIAEKGELAALEAHGVDWISVEYSKPLGKQHGIVGQTLTGYYFNSRAKSLRIVADHYFFEYWKNGQRVSANTVK